MLVRNVLNNWNGWLSAVVILGATDGIANPGTGVLPGVESIPAEPSPLSPSRAFRDPAGCVDVK